MFILWTAWEIRKWPELPVLPKMVIFSIFLYIANCLQTWIEKQADRIRFEIHKCTFFTNLRHLFISQSLNMFSSSPGIVSPPDCVQCGVGLAASPSLVGNMNWNKVAAKNVEVPIFRQCYAKSVHFCRNGRALDASKSVCSINRKM